MHYTVGKADDLGVENERIRAYLRAEWKRPLCLVHPRFYDWQFRDPPAANGRDHSIVLIDEHGAVHGYLGANPRPFHLDGRLRRGAELTTYLVTPDLQGKGWAPRMVQALFEDYEFLAANSPTAASLPVFTRLGFRYIRSLPRFARVVDPERVMACGEFDPLGRKLIRTYAALRRPFCGQAEEVGLADCDEAERIPSQYNAFLRDPAHLLWRYARHPVYPYRTFRVRGKDGSCVLILRLDDAEALRVLHVVELFGEEKTFPAAVSFADQLARDEGAHLADFSCASERTAAPFWAQGWFSSVDDTHVRIPHLFYPLELRTPTTGKLVFWSNLPDTSYCDRTRLYLTKGDCDLDRPTQPYLDRHGIDFAPR